MSTGGGYRQYINSNIRLGGYVFLDIGSDLTGMVPPISSLYSKRELQIEMLEKWRKQIGGYETLFLRGNIGLEFSENAFNGSLNLYFPLVSMLEPLKKIYIENGDNTEMNPFIMSYFN